MNVTLHDLPTTLIDKSGDPKAPLLVAMHGIGSNERDLVSAYHSLESQAVLAFPRSPLPHPPGYAWYRLIRIGVPDPASFDAAIETLGLWLRALRAEPGMADRPVILSGFSQGAIMALSYAIGHPDQIAGVIAFSGYIPSGVLETALAGKGQEHAVRILLAHGRRDQLFPFARLEETAQQLEQIGIRPTLAPHDSGHDIPPSAMEAAKAWLAQEFPTR